MTCHRVGTGYDPPWHGPSCPESVPRRLARAVSATLDALSDKRAAAGLGLMRALVDRAGPFGRAVLGTVHASGDRSGGRGRATTAATLSCRHTPSMPAGRRAGL
jgi:hypothetical protein